MNTVQMLVHGTHETNAFPRNGPDQPLRLAAVADRAPGGVDAAVECRVRYDPAAPYQGHEMVSGDDVISMLQQMNQQVEYLWLHCNQVAVAAQLAKAGVQGAIVEVKSHVRRRVFSQETIKSI